MGVTGKGTEHPVGISSIPGLPQNFAVTDHNGVRSDDDIIVVTRNSHSLQPTHPGNFIRCLGICVHGFINIRHLYFKGYAE